MHLKRLRGGVCRLRLYHRLEALVEIGVLDCGVNNGRKPLRVDKVGNIHP
jgi:hypothetical protein